jgi:hypothetical protein
LTVATVLPTLVDGPIVEQLRKEVHNVFLSPGLLQNIFFLADIIRDPY